MKRTTFLSLFILIFSICNAQFREKTQDYRFHQHKGFYLSMSLGPNFASISDKVAGSYDYVFSGTGAQFDLKIGGAISGNLILHATIISNSLTGSKIKSDGVSQNTSNNVTIGEAMFGAGITYYVMPSNILLSGSLGLGNFTVLDNGQKNSVSSDKTNWGPTPLSIDIIQHKSSKKSHDDDNLIDTIWQTPSAKLPNFTLGWS